MFSVPTRPEEFKNATITGHFGFVFEENSVREIAPLSWRHFEKLCFQNVFFYPAVSNSFGLKSVIKKAPFQRRIRVNGRPNRRNNAAFSN